MAIWPNAPHPLHLLYRSRVTQHLTKCTPPPPSTVPLPSCSLTKCTPPPPYTVPLPCITTFEEMHPTPSIYCTAPVYHHIWPNAPHPLHLLYRSRVSQHLTKCTHPLHLLYRSRVSPNLTKCTPPPPSTVPLPCVTTFDQMHPTPSIYCTAPVYHHIWPNAPPPHPSTVPLCYDILKQTCLPPDLNSPYPIPTHAALLDRSLVLHLHQQPPHLMGHTLLKDLYFVQVETG